MADAHKNLAVSTVATAPSPAASGTSLVVASGHGARFPTPPFNATVWLNGEIPDPSNAEIVRVTAISTDTFTIARAQESTTARSIVVGDLIAATITAKTLTDVESRLQPRGWAPGAQPYRAWTTNIAAPSNAYIVGYDETGDYLLAVNKYAGTLVQSTAYGDPPTWSDNKTFPSDVTYLNLSRIVRHGSYLYAACKVTTGDVLSIFRASPQSGGTDFTWNLVFNSYTSGTTTGTGAAGSGFLSDGTYIYSCEYGDPVGGPKLWRSDSGDSGDWTSIYTFSGYRHIHALANDGAGRLWIALGDGVATPILYSDDHGASWTAIPLQNSRIPQITDICCTANWVYGAGDDNNGMVVAIDRSTLTWRFVDVGMPPGYFAIPASGGTASTRSYSNFGLAGQPFWIWANPASDDGDELGAVVYFATASDTNQSASIWVLPYHGAVPSILRLADTGVNMSKFFYAGSRIWCGNYHSPAGIPTLLKA